MKRQKVMGDRTNREHEICRRHSGFYDEGLNQSPALSFYIL
jgi:hypothetical protein